MQGSRHDTPTERMHQKPPSHIEKRRQPRNRACSAVLPYPHISEVVDEDRSSLKARTPACFPSLRPTNHRSVPKSTSTSKRTPRSLCPEKRALSRCSPRLKTLPVLRASAPKSAVSTKTRFVIVPDTRCRGLFGAIYRGCVTYGQRIPEGYEFEVSVLVERAEEFSDVIVRARIKRFPPRSFTISNTQF